MTSLNESQINATAHETAATAAANMAAPVENLIEHPRGAEPGKPGRRDAFYFEQKTRLPDAADGKGRGGARYGRIADDRYFPWGCIFRQYRLKQEHEK